MFRIVNENVRHNCIEEIKKIPLNKYQVDIKEIKRSNPQNSLYWKWVGVISKELGYTTDELHHAFKAQFIGVDQSGSTE